MKKAYQFQILKEARQPAGHMLYFVSHKAANGALTEYWIGANRLKRYYEQDKIVGPMGNTIRAVVGKEPKKPKSKVKLTPRDENYVREGAQTIAAPVKSAWAELKEQSTKKWNLTEEWVAPNWSEPEKAVEKIEEKPKPIINIKAYLYEDKGRWHVIECNGIEDEDTYPNKEWAQRVVDDLNNSSTDELDKV